MAELSKKILTEMQFKNEVLKCEYCEERPCKDGCPAGCSPFDFIMASRLMEKQDFLRAAAIIMKNNPLGGICGFVCPDRHCMAKCSRRDFDGSVKIPEVQAYIIQKAKELGGIPEFLKPRSNGKKVAIVGSGPAGLSCAAFLAQKGFKVKIYEEKKKPGGALNLIPDFRLPRRVIEGDIEFVKTLGDIEIETGKKIDRAFELLEEYDAVVVAVGLWQPVLPGIKGEEKAITMVDYLSNPKKYKFTGKVAVIGGGATAVDCAVTAKKRGAKSVEMFALETLAEMPLTEKEKQELFENGIEVSGRTTVLSINVKKGKILNLKTAKVKLVGKKFSLKDI
ncbi:MAG: FAD-dependent oxidoreductase [Elusimicrobia bacterium]|nr:FAD-dependent oxidoreductase [Elusimicrobiota bacterium]